IPAATTIVSVTDATHAVMSANATAGHAGQTLTLGDAVAGLNNVRTAKQRAWPAADFTMGNTETSAASAFVHIERTIEARTSGPARNVGASAGWKRVDYEVGVRFV